MRDALLVDGYASVTIEGLASEAQVAKQTIYRWWPSKAAILAEVLLDGELPGGDVEAPFTHHLDVDLRGWFTEMSRQLTDGQGVELARALIAVTATDPDLGAELNARLAGPIAERISARLAVAQQSGALRDDVDAQLVADQFVATATYAALLGRPLDAERIDALVALILHGIAA